MNYDAIVIGAGPAGSTVSTLLAQRGYRVLLLEKSRFPREKLCGEFITPECLKIFDLLGVRERLIDAGAKLIGKMTLFAPDGRGIEVPMEWIARGHPYALSLTRARMDSILLDRARESGVDVREGFLISPRFNLKDGFGIIEGKSGLETIERFSAPVVIDASGRNGVFSTQVQQHESLFEGSRLFGCKAHLRGLEGLNGNGELFFFRDGYGGLTDVEGGRTNLCFITTESTLRETKGDREKLLDLTLRSNPAAREKLENAVIIGEWHGAGPLNYGRKRSIRGVLAIGDAGAFIDPFTGTGILLALVSGEMAAVVIDQSFSAGVRDPEEIAKNYYRMHSAFFGLRYRASELLRGLAFRPVIRNALVSLLSRHDNLMRLIAKSTRLRTSENRFESRL